MPPSRPTVRCCRAAKQHIRAPLDHIWITDSVLSSAFDRYCYVSRLSRRTSSSVPGPLENRRRLGKRKITGLQLDHQSTLPAWNIDFPVDLTKWKWQPPTVSPWRDEKGLQSQQDELEPVWIPKWISKWKSKWKAEETWSNELDAERTDDESSTSTAALLARLSHARSAVAASTPKTIKLAFYDFIESFEQDLKLGVLHPTTVDMAVSTFPQSLIEMNADYEVVSRTTERFLSAVVNGIASSKVLAPADFDGSFWNQLLKRVSQLRVDYTTTILFRTTLDAVPCIDDVHDGIVAAVQALTVSGSTGRRRAAEIGFALRKLSPILHDELLLKIEAAVYKGSAVFEGTGCQKHRFLWLQILAHMPTVNRDYLLDAFVRSAYFDGKVHSTFGRDICQLLILQWRSRGYLTAYKEFVTRWIRDCSGRDELCLAALAMNLPKNLPRRTALKHIDIWVAMRRLGRTEEILRSIQAFCETAERLRVWPLKMVAVTSNDYRVALRISSLMDTHSSKLTCKTELRWSWIDWERYMKDMIMDKTVPVSTIWRLVQSGATRKYPDPVDQQAFIKRKERMMTKMAVWFSEAEHLSDKETLHQITRCLGWLKGHNLHLSNHVLMALVSVVMRDLKRGEAGRTSRINWVLSLVEQRFGPEERQKLGRAFQRWREINGELRVEQRLRREGSGLTGPR